MKSVFTQLAALFFFLNFSVKIFAQPVPLPPCTGQPPFGFTQTPADNCFDVCLSCNFQNMVGNTNNFTPDNFSVFCSNGTIENNQWYAFNANSSQITITGTTPLCNDGNGIQLAVLEQDCGGQIVACNTGCTGCAGLPIEVNFTAVPGQTYLLMVDGFAGDVCQFELEISPSNAGVAQPIPPLQPIQGPAVVCPGNSVEYSVPPVANAGFYVWTAPVGWLINGQVPPVGEPAPWGSTVTVTAGAAGTTGQICVSATNACFVGNQVCKPVAAQPLPTTTLPPISVCFEDTPYFFHDTPVYISGLYQTTLVSWQGCDSVVRQHITVFPQKIKNLGSLALCPGQSVQVCGQNFSTVGNFNITCTAANGCDSLNFFTLIPANQTAATITARAGACGNLPYTLSTPFIANAARKWTGPNGQPLGGAPSITASTAGTYLLEVKFFSPTGDSCSFSSSVNVQPNPYSVSIAAPPPLNLCNIAPVQISASSTPTAIDWQWSGPNGFFSTQPSIAVLEPGLYSVTATTADSCQTAASVELLAVGTPPVFDLAADTISCCSPSANILVSGNAQNLTYSWSGPGGFSSTQEDLAVSLPGIYLLTATDPMGCQTVKGIQVFQKFDPPQIASAASAITCTAPTAALAGSSTTTGATFEWAGPGGFTSNQANATATVAGDYVLTVFDPSNCCSASQTVQVFENKNAPSVNPSGTTVLNCGAPTGFLKADLPPTNPNFSYSWDGPNFSKEPKFEVLIDTCGAYTVTVTDLANGCTASASRWVDCDFVAPSFVFTGDTVINCLVGAVSPEPFSLQAGVSFEWVNDDPPFSMPGNFPVLATGTNGCTSTKSVQILGDFAKPDFQITGNTQLTCAQTTVSPILVASQPGVAFAWLGVQPPFQNAGVYTVVATGTNGCTSTKFVPISQNIVKPDVQIVGNTVLTCAQTTTTLTPVSATPNVVFAWLTMGWPPTGPVVVDKAGTYSLTATAPNGCTETATVTVVDSCLISSEQPDIFLEKLKIYPSPAATEVFVETTADAGLAAVAAFDAAGNFLFSKNLNFEKMARLDLRGLPAGSYFLKIKIGDRWVSRRVLVSRR